MKAHSKNPNMVVLKELSNDYLMVEFVRIDEKTKDKSKKIKDKEYLSFPPVGRFGGQEAIQG